MSLLTHPRSMSSDSSSPIAVIGLGYVGLPLAVEFGRVRPVVGFDINPQRIAELQKIAGEMGAPPPPRDPGPWDRAPRHTPGPWG